MPGLSDLNFRSQLNRELTEGEHDENLAILAEQIQARATVNHSHVIVSPATGNALSQKPDGGAYLSAAALGGGGGGGAVTSVNGKEGAVDLTADDVGAADAADLAAISGVVSGKADASAVAALASSKADKTYVDAELADKADAATVSALAAAVAGKADASAVTAKADKTYVDTGLAGKAAQADLVALTTTVGNKADASTVSALATAKADKTYVDTGLAGKASTSDLATLSTAVAGKADTAALASLTATVSGKADAAAVASALGGKANTSDLAALAATVAGKASSDDARFSDKRVPAAGEYGGFTMSALGVATLNAAGVVAAITGASPEDAAAIADALVEPVAAAITGTPFPRATLLQFADGTTDEHYPSASAIRYMGLPKAVTYAATPAIRLDCNRVADAGPHDSDTLIATIAADGDCTFGFTSIHDGLARQKGEVIVTNSGGGARVVAPGTANGVTVIWAPGVTNPGLGSAAGDSVEYAYTILSATAVRIDSAKAYPA